MNLKQFVATRRELTVATYCDEFGMLPEDFQDTVERLLTYQGGMYIEKHNPDKIDSVYQLPLERSCYCVKDEAELLELEERLYDYAKGEGFLPTPMVHKPVDELELSGFYMHDQLRNWAEKNNCTVGSYGPKKEGGELLLIESHDHTNPLRISAVCCDRQSLNGGPGYVIVYDNRQANDVHIVNNFWALNDEE